MDYISRNGVIIIAKTEDFNADLIFGCGQCFRWDRRDDGSWLGIAKNRVLTLVESEEDVGFNCSEDEFKQIWIDYFDLDRDYAAVRKEISSDGFTALAAEYGKGIRVLHQDPWETLCTFIISQCNNIKRIKGIVDRLCNLFGYEYIHEGISHHLFPSPERMASLSPSDLEPLRAGYRADYLLNAAREVAGGSLDLESLRHLSTAGVIGELTKLKGVGDKVARCVALFGVGKTDSFPVDVWIKRAIESHYGGNTFDSSVFGPVAGIAQQYIFHYIRNLKETA